jgi:hypothetical protein
MTTGPLPLVTTLHGTDITLVGASEEFNLLTRLALWASNQVTVVSAVLARENVYFPGNESILELCKLFVRKYTNRGLE